jgi:L-threonylcarbamoyladenylate synthase
MKHLEATSENIDLAAETLRKGGLVAFPTETVYGLGADGLNEIAVSKIFEVKKRPSFNPLILHVSSNKMLNEIATFSSTKINLLIETFWPGPLTLILRKRDTVPYIVTSGLDTVAVRMPGNKIALELIEKLGNPIAAPSANEFSRLSPTKAEHVISQLGNKIDIVLDGGKCNVGLESTIIEISDESQKLLRPGGVPKESIEDVIGELEISGGDEKIITSPGQLNIHYAPSTPIKFYSKDDLDSLTGLRLGGIFYSHSDENDIFAAVKILSPKREIHEAASNLFLYLHELDSLKLDLILVEPLEEKGLGIAIMDRLRKAVNKYS